MLTNLRSKFGLFRSFATKQWGKYGAKYLDDHRKPFQILSTLGQRKTPNFYVTTKRQSGTRTTTIKEYPSSRKYTGLWKLERMAGASLIFLVPLAFYCESNVVEMALGFVATLHTYWGCESMCKDYLRSSVVGNVLPVLARTSNIVLSVATLVGIHHLIYKDCGIVKLIKQLWAIRGYCGSVDKSDQLIVGISAGPSAPSAIYPEGILNSPYWWIVKKLVSTKTT